MKLYFFILAFAATTFYGCNNASKQSADESSTDQREVNDSSRDFDTKITGKYWKLLTLEGQTAAMAENQEKEIYFTLKTDENRVEGFAGCNGMTGSYSLEDGNRISFENMAVTMMACPDVDVKEGDFLQVFELTDNYTIQNDTLSLNVGRRAPLAVFTAVYFE